ncbi:myb-like protein D isoform X2 [Condylostylus longicornis]|uniref:myb-like protein D isoform X2 n=1 Tax=Condylostylus longicornis TaxID=2530218 RepID=UPI00244E2B98|nr:myb-like protein D isoform X2 [Condylostylus longicornis]
MEGNNEMTSECMLGRNYYYQKRINLDPERCKLNMERAIKRKQRESQVNVACDHYRANDKCQIRNISYEELEDNNESNKSFESNRKAQPAQRSKLENDEGTNENDNAIFEPQVKNLKRESSYVAGDNDEENESVNIFQPAIDIKEKSHNEKEATASQTQSTLKKPSLDSSAARDNSEADGLPSPILRKQSVYESVEERMAAREKARAILENFHWQANRMKRPPHFNQPYSFPNQINRLNQLAHSNWQSRNYPPNLTAQRNFPTSSYMGPENWQRTLERNIRRRQRMQEVKIDCNHNLTRFCKVISVAQEDLVNFHNMYWNCQGIVEERIFLARYMVVTPCNHRREMAIATRIPTSDGQLVEVCQKSFLSVVGITKHKVQAAARAKLKGTLFRKDQRGGFQKPRSQTEQPLRTSQNMQISKVEGRYTDGDRPRKGFNESETIEIEDSSEDDRENNGDNDNSSNHNINFEDSQTGNGEDDDDDDSHIISAEDAFANGKLNYYEFRKNIRKTRTNEMYEAQLTRMKTELNFYKRRTRKLYLDRRNYITKLAKLRMENIKIRKQLNNSQKISNEKKIDVTSVQIETNVNKENNEQMNGAGRTDFVEHNSNIQNSHPKENLVTNECDRIIIPNFGSNYDNYEEEETILKKISETYQNFDCTPSLLEKIARIDEPMQSENS